MLRQNKLLCCFCRADGSPEFQPCLVLLGTLFCLWRFTFPNHALPPTTSLKWRQKSCDCPGLLQRGKRSSSRTFLSFGLELSQTRFPLRQNLGSLWGGLFLLWRSVRSSSWKGPSEMPQTVAGQQLPWGDYPGNRSPLPSLLLNDPQTETMINAPLPCPKELYEFMTDGGA